jgi:hypothetical protein
MSQYPNVRARLQLTLLHPTLPVRRSVMAIWLKGTRFRVRDEAGRHVAAILDDVAAPRGLGAPIRSLEEAMDIWSQPQNGRSSATDLYGDRAISEAWVRRGDQPPWPMPADALAAVAEQVLAGEPDARLQPQGPVTRLGRQATEYRGVLRGEDQAGAYACEVTRIVSPPYLLLSEVRNANNAEQARTLKVIALEEGACSDADLAPGG